MSSPSNSGARPTIPAMITMFHTSGAIAGIAKWSWTLRIPTARPVSPSRITIGNSTCDRPTASASSAGVNSSPVKSGISHGAIRMKRERDQRQPDQQQPGERARELIGLALLLVLQQLAEDRDEGAGERRVGHQRADQVRDLEGERERRRGAAGAEIAGGDDLADQPRDARQTRRDREDQRVDGGTAWGVFGGQAARYSTPPSRPIRDLFTMANIKSQIKRNNRSRARALREPPLHVADQDVFPAPRDRRDRR